MTPGLEQVRLTQTSPFAQAPQLKVPPHPSLCTPHSAFRVSHVAGSQAGGDADPATQVPPEQTSPLPQSPQLTMLPHPSPNIPHWRSASDMWPVRKLAETRALRCRCRQSTFDRCYSCRSSGSRRTRCCAARTRRLASDRWLVRRAVAAPTRLRRRRSSKSRQSRRRHSSTHRHSRRLAGHTHGRGSHKWMARSPPRPSTRASKLRAQRLATTTLPILPAGR